MSMSKPFEPDAERDDGIPSADPGPGAAELPRDDVPFRTPDPRELGHGPPS
jgi:hypothetical protein